MKHSRILRTTNLQLLAIGYQIHWYVAKTQHFRLTYLGVANLVVLSCIYIACFARHFESVAVLKVIQDVSPFLYHLTRLHLLLGVKVFVYTIYRSLRSVGAVNAIVQQLPAEESTRGFSKNEFIGYLLIFTTHSVLFCFGIYIAYQMEFKPPPFENLMIILALYLPHLLLSGALRLYTILVWLSSNHLHHIAIATSENFHGEVLVSYGRQVQRLVECLKALFDGKQHALLLLIGVNANCLLGGLYSLIYYYEIWHVMFDDARKRAFYAGNLAIYTCIGIDYVCLLWTQSRLENECAKFSTTLSCLLRTHNDLDKKSRRILKDMREVLSNACDYKFLQFWKFDVQHFILIPILQLIFIGIIVTFLYFYDAIKVIESSINSDDE